MRLHFALLLSLSLHLAITLSPNPAPQKPADARSSIHATLQETELHELPAEVNTVSESSAAAFAAKSPMPALQPGKALQNAQSRLMKHLFYPPEAVRRGLEGEVLLLLTLDTAGRILSIAIARSSGHTLLDIAAQDAAQQIGLLPGNPHETLLPVSFRLD